MATLVYQSLSGRAPAYLATNCQLVSNVYQIKDVVCCQTDLQQLRRQVFCSGGFRKALQCDNCVISNHSATICDRMSPTLESIRGGSLRAKIWGGSGWPM